VRHGGVDRVDIQQQQRGTETETEDHETIRQCVLFYSHAARAAVVCFVSQITTNGYTK